jgi:hypothetical protein
VLDFFYWLTLEAPPPANKRHAITFNRDAGKLELQVPQSDGSFRTFYIQSGDIETRMTETVAYVKANVK